MKFPVALNVTTAKHSLFEVPVVGTVTVVEAESGFHIVLGKEVRVVVSSECQISFEKHVTGQPKQWLQEYTAGEKEGVQVWSDQRPVVGSGRRVVKVNLGVGK